MAHGSRSKNEVGGGAECPFPSAQAVSFCSLRSIFLGKGSINDGLLWGLPGAIQGKPKGGGEKATSLRLPAWFFQGEKLAMHNGSGVLVEAEHNLHARNAAVNAIRSEPGPLG